jgi:hypothetical protein
MLHEIHRFAGWNDADEIVNNMTNDELIAGQNRFDHVGVYLAKFT